MKESDYATYLFGVPIRLLVCFMGGLVAYEICVYQLNTDYEYVLQDYEATAHQQLMENIAKNQGLEAAQQGRTSLSKPLEINW